MSDGGNDGGDGSNLVYATTDLQGPRRRLVEDLLDFHAYDVDAVLNKAAHECVETCFTRLDTQRNQCTFGKNGVCCRLCYMGPCRITPKAPRGICGADADTIVARVLDQIGVENTVAARWGQ